MEKQYRDLVENLVKAHSKFSGQEEFLNEIVDDVLDYSKIVMSTVTDQSVIINYFHKVITSSIIKIQKKHGAKNSTKSSAQVLLENIEMAKISKANELQAMKEAREKESNKSSNNTIAIAEPLKKVEQTAEIIQEDSVKSSSNEEVLEVETVFEEPDTVDNIDVLEDALAVQEEIIAVDENELVEATLEENNEFIDEIEIMNSGEQLVSEELEDVELSPEEISVEDVVENSENDIQDFVTENEEVVEEELLPTEISEEENILELQFATEDVDCEIEEENVEITTEVESLVLTENVDEYEEDVIEEIKPDMALVDKMINGVSKNSEEESLEADSEVEDLISSDIDDLTIASQDEIDMLNAVDDILEPENFAPLEFSSEEELVEEVDDIEELQEDESSQELEMVDLEEDLVDDSKDIENTVLYAKNVAEQVVEDELLIESMEEEDLTLNTENEIYDLEEVDSSMDLQVEDSEENLLIEDVEETTSLVEETVEEVVAVENSNNELQNMSKQTSTDSMYSCFAFDVSDEGQNYVASDIISVLKDYNRKYPNNRVFEICDLKYKQQHTVTEISNKLGITLDKVIEVLNDVINIVKD